VGARMYCFCLCFGHASNDIGLPKFFLFIYILDDIRKECGDSPLCYDFSRVETFLNLQSTKDALHVSSDSSQWESCNTAINMHFGADWMQNYAPFVADLLNDGIPVLIYAGDCDFICNYLGNRAWAQALDWDHKKDFSAAKDHEWEGGGMAKTANGFTFLQVYNAGHMVPRDQSDFALKMITHFMSGEVF